MDETLPPNAIGVPITRCNKLEPEHEPGSALPTPTSLPLLSALVHTPLPTHDSAPDTFTAPAASSHQAGRQSSEPLSESSTSGTGHSEAASSSSRDDLTAHAPFLLDEEALATSPEARLPHGTLTNAQLSASTSNLTRHPLLSPPASPRAERASSSTAAVSTADAFSSLTRAPRIWRARYDDQRANSPDSGTGERAQSSQHAFKRAFDQVSPTTGTTPPAVDRASSPLLAEHESFSPTTTDAAVTTQSNSLLRHSFESQRATLSPRMRHLRDNDGASLRRRSPVTSRSGSRDRATRNANASTDSTRDRSKRQRADSAANDDMDLDEEPIASVSTSTSLSTSFAPALGRYPSRALPSDPVLVSATQGRQSVAASQDADAPSSRRQRLSLSSVSHFPSFSSFRRNSSSNTPSSAAQPPASDDAVGTTSSFRAVPPPAASTLVMRPRSARVGSDNRRSTSDEIAQILADGREQIRATEEFTAQSRAILLQAGAMLSRATALLESTTQDLENVQQLHQIQAIGLDVDVDAQNADERAARMLEQLPSPDLPLPVTVEAQQRNIDLPSTRHLPPPVELDERPVIGIRIGEGWTTRRASSQEQPSPTTEDASAVLSPASDETSGSSGSRAIHFLANLRSRRPRLARNSTGVPPPEESPEIISPDREGSGWLAHSRRDDSARRDETSDTHQRWRDFLRVRTPAESSSSSSTSLWGQVGSAVGDEGPLNTSATTDTAQGGRRLRGPTERANALWRMGQTPSAALPSTTTTTHATALAQTMPPWRASRSRASVAGSDTSFPAFNLRSRTQAGRAVTSSVSPSTNPTTGASSVERMDDGDRLSSPRRRSIFNSSSWEADRRRPASDAPAEQTSHERTTRIQAIRQPVRFQPSRSYAAAVRGASATLTTGERSATMRTRRNVLAAGADDDDVVEASPEQSMTFVGPPNMLPSGSAGRRAGPSAEVVTTAATTGEVEAGGRRESQNRLQSLIASRLSRRLANETSSSTRDAEDNLAEERIRSRRRRVQALAEERRQAAEAIDREMQLMDQLRGETASGDGHDNSGATLRRRRTIYDPPGAALPLLEFDLAAGPSAAERSAARVERLANLARERSSMRSLLARSALTDAAGSSTGGEATEAGTDARDEALPGTTTTTTTGAPLSPHTRRRSLGELFRGLGGMGGRWIAAWDDDFIGFFTRDSAALDPRNYQADDEFDDSYDALIRLSERLGDVKQKGLSAEKVSELRTTKYKDWPRARPSADENRTDGSNVASTSQVPMDVDDKGETGGLAKRGVDKEERCAVCLQDYEDEDDVMFGLCSHGFHADCLKAWLKEHGTCPVCRRDHSK
ncbi:hypothetical protein ACM66B_002274 [Microbotryomycetes sp. NB124-2]